MFSGYKIRLLTKQNSHNLGQCGRFFQVKSTYSIFWYDLNISWHFTMQVPQYYISLEGCNFPLSTVIINVSNSHTYSHYTHCKHIYFCLIYLSYFQSKYWLWKCTWLYMGILSLTILSTKLHTLKLMIYKINN